MAVESFAAKSEMKALATALVERYQWMRQAGFSFGGDRDLYSVLGYDRNVSAKQYRDEYARGGIAARIVEAYPKATWRGGVELYEDEDPKVSTAFEEAWTSIEQRLGIWSILQRADILAGLSTYSVILIGAPGSFDEELPKGKPEQVLYLTPFAGGGGPNMSAVGASNFVDATIQEFDIDASSPRFGLPTTYQLRRMDITSPELMKPVHWSRIIHVAEGCLDNEVYGVPVLESIWNYLMDLTKVAGGGAEAFWLRANQGLALNLEKDMDLSPDAAAKLKDEVDEYRHNISRVLKTRGMEIQTLGSDVANFSNPVESILTLIAGTKGIPKRILMGSEMGQLASGQDADNWATQVQDRRTGYAGPRIVRPLVDRLIEYGYLPKPKKSYSVGWPVVESLSEAEKSAGAAAWAGVNASYGGIVFTDAEIREHFYGLEPLSEEDRAAATPAQPEAPAEAPLAPGEEPVPEGDPDAAPDDEAEADALIEEMLRAAEFVGLGGKGSGVKGHTTAEDPPENVSTAPPAPEVRKYPLVRSPQGVEAKVARRSIKESQAFAEKAAAKLIAKGFKEAKAKAKKDAAKSKKDAAKAKKDANKRELVHDDGRKATIVISDTHVQLMIGKRVIAETKIKKHLKTALLFAEEHEFSSLQVQLPGALAKKLLEFADYIPDEDLAEDGREDDPHVTVKYGLHTNNADDVRRVRTDGPIELTLGKINYFETDEYDVLYAEVESPDLEKLNAEVCASLKVTDTQEDYIPHATIAYLKPGLGEEYAGDDALEGLSASISQMMFCSKDEEKEPVDLGLRASEEVELLRVLEAAIRADHEDVISAIVGVTHRAAATHVFNEPYALGGPGSGYHGHGGGEGGPGNPGGSKPREAYPKANHGESMMDRNDGHGLDSLQQFTQANGQITPERKALHDKIVAEVMAGHKPAEGRPVAHMMGGGGASGKSSLQPQLTFPEDQVWIDVDLIRTKLPEWDEEIRKAVAEGRTTHTYMGSFTHEEASVISKRCIDEAAKGGYNLMVDGAGDTSIEKVAQNVARYRAGGQSVEVDYVTVDYDLAYQRMRARGDAIVPETGLPYGRYIPAAHLREVHAEVARVFPAAVERGLFDKFSLWDTSTSVKIGTDAKGKPIFSPPIKVASGYGKQITIHDQALYDRFVAKGAGIDPRKGEK